MHTTQRLTRLHQLLAAIAKLAAAQDDQQRLDRTKLRHSNFLTDCIFQRQKRHVEEMAIVLFKMSHLSSKCAAALSSSSPPAATA